MDQKKINDVLTKHYWPPNIVPRAYVTTHDDNDGEPRSGLLRVIVGVDGDVWIRTEGLGALRFRSGEGGGKYLRVRNALLLLADAIRQEGDEGLL